MFAFRRLPIALVLTCALAHLPASAHATAVPADIQQRIIASFAASLVNPDTTDWEFDDFVPFTSGGNVACGRVNYQDSTKTYIGWRGFYAIVRGSEITTEGILPRHALQDATGAALYDYNFLCHQHVKLEK